MGPLILMVGYSIFIFKYLQAMASWFLLILCFLTCHVAILVTVCLLPSKDKMSSYFEEKAPCCGSHFWVLFSTCWAFVLFAAITSGLALGLLSFSQVDLEVLVKAGKPQIQKNAAKIMSVVKNEHLLLCTLLMAKSLALEGVSVFMEKMFPEWTSVLMSAAMLAITAEIIPQALCSRYGLSVGAALSPFVRVLMLIFFPIAYPLSKLLDWLLGKGHTALLGRAELKTLVHLHADEAGKGGELTLHETKIIAGALDLTQKTAKDAMTPLSETFSLDINSKLDMHTMGLIMSKGHSRIPIYSGKQTNIVGIILVRNLIFCRPEDEIPIKYMTIRRVPRVAEDWPLYDILNQFKNGQSHMAVVLKGDKNIKIAATDKEGKNPGLGSSCEPGDYIRISTDASDWHSQETEYYSATLKSAMNRESDAGLPQRIPEQPDASSSFENVESFPTKDEEVVGIITLEDVMEELLQEDILDETDQYVDVHQNIKIKLQHARRVSTGSSRRASSSRQQRRSSDASRLYFLTPTYVLPVSP